MKQFFISVAMALFTGTANAQHCDSVSETVGILINGDGVIYTMMTDEPISFMTDAPLYGVNVIPSFDLVENGLMSKGVEDLYGNMTSEFDGVVEQARSKVIQNDSSAYVLVTGSASYVYYDGNSIDWSNIADQSVFLNVYGQDMTDSMNILVNTAKTVKGALDRTDSICSIQTTDLSLQAGMLRPQARPLTP